ncbi:MAG TPA: phosphotransferase family protein [Caulobacteraceae bacterium]|nr:phosphotransferase family protein [Caulobacteraceae bacterium]
MADDPSQVARTAPEAIAEQLNVVARQHFPAASGIARLQRVTACATQEIWRFELVQGAGETPMILRRAPGGNRVSATGAGMEAEASLLKAAAEAGVPVPAVRHVLTPEDGLGHGFIMDFVDGETLGGRIVRDERFATTRPKLAYQCGEILARLHQIPREAAPQLKVSTPEELLAQWRTSYENSNWPRPVFDLTFAWLAARIPPPPANPRLVHGDFRNGNLIFRPQEGVVAVLDWELAHVGDPLEDLGWICANPWRFGISDKPVGGFGEREDMYAGYEAESGLTLDRAHVRFWEVLGALKWGVMCAGMTASFRTGDPSVERAVIARRSSETEIDLLRMLAPLPGKGE